MPYSFTQNRALLAHSVKNLHAWLTATYDIELCVATKSMEQQCGLSSAAGGVKTYILSDRKMLNFSPQEVLEMHKIWQKGLLNWENMIDDENAFAGYFQLTLY